MNCPFCRRQIVENSEFCPYCGNKIEKNTTPIQNYTENNYSSPNKKSNFKVRFIIVIILLFIIVGIYWTNRQKNANIKQENQTTNGATKNPANTGNLDENVNTVYDENGAFLMPIEDVFTITGRGTVVTGRIERGTIHIGDEVNIIGLNKEMKTVKVTGIEQFRQQLDSAKIGENVGILLENVAREEVERGQVLSLPNSIIAATKFEANIDVLSKEEGGRHTPFFNNYRPQFYFRTIDITGVMTLPEGIETVNPGESVQNVIVELETSVALEIGTEFSIREGGRTIGKGVISKVIE